MNGMPETIVNDLHGLALPFDPEEAKPAEGSTLDTEGWITKQVAAIGHLREAVADLDATRQGLVDNVNEHYEAKMDQRRASVDWLVGRLSPIVAIQIAGTKKKSVSTPCGIVGFRSAKAKPDWPADDVLLATIDKADLPSEAVRDVPAERKPDKKWLNTHLIITENGDDGADVTVTYETEDGTPRTVALDIETIPADKTFYVKPTETMGPGRFLRTHKGGA